MIHLGEVYLTVPKKVNGPLKGHIKYLSLGQCHLIKLQTRSTATTRPAEPLRCAGRWASVLELKQWAGVWRRTTLRNEYLKTISTWLRIMINSIIKNKTISTWLWRGVTSQKDGRVKELRNEVGFRDASHIITDFLIDFIEKPVLPWMYTKRLK